MPKSESVLSLKMLLFCFHAANMIIVSFLPLFLQHKGLDGFQIGWVLAIGPMASIFAQPFWGYMSDKYQTVKRMIIICIFGVLVMSNIFFRMEVFPLLMTAGAMFFFFAVPIGGLSDSLAQRRSAMIGKSFGTIRTWGSIGFAVSSLLVGEFLDSFGIDKIVWPYLFFAGAALIVTMNLNDIKVNTKPVQLKDVKKLITNRPLLIFLILIMFITIAHRANDSFMGIYLAELGGNERLIGIAWFVGVASEALVFAIAGFWFRKFHPLIFIVIAGLLYSVRWWVYSFVDNPLIIVGFQLLHGFTFAVFYLSAFDYVTRLIPKELQSTGHLLFSTVFLGLSGILGSLLGGSIIDITGGGTLYFIMGTMAFIGSVLLALYHYLPYGKV